MFLYQDKVHIIAEAGSNHNGDVGLAKRLIETAANCGADSVKFQLINPEKLYLPYYVEAGNTHKNPAYAQRKREQLSKEDWAYLKQVSASKQIEFSSSIFDEEGLSFIQSLDPLYIKIASTDVNNTPLLDLVADCGKPIILSTGMASLSEIEKAVKVFDQKSATKQLILLHCVSTYPCQLEDSNIFMIDKLKFAFDLPVGFSDHTLGYEAAVMAVSRGATVIEKHFTTDKTLPGFDHAHALDPEELKQFVDKVRSAYTACQPKLSKVSDAEQETSLRARRGLYAARHLNSGHVIQNEDVLMVRPSAHLGPEDRDSLVGEKVSQPIQRYEPFSYDINIVPGAPTWKQANSYWDKEMYEKGLMPSSNKNMSKE